MRLYFVRHGESEANVLHVISNRGRQHGLTALGCSQAAQLAVLVSGCAPSHIFTSPLLRAVETAEILSAKLGVPCEVTDALREYDCGIIEGRSDEAAWRMWSAEMNAWMCGDRAYHIPAGESFLDMQARFIPFIDALTSAYGPTDSRIVLVSHGGLYRCMLPLVLHNVDAQFALTHGINNTGVIIVEWQSEGLLCREWCGAVP